MPCTTWTSPGTQSSGSGRSTAWGISSTPPTPIPRTGTGSGRAGRWWSGRGSGSRWEEPDWLDRPALSRITASSPHVLRPFGSHNAGKPYAEQVKPFNFLLSAQVAPFGHPEGVDPTRFHLVAPWSSYPVEWIELPWLDLHSGREFRITTTDDLGA
jgi:hypothetical protein